MRFNAGARGGRRARRPVRGLRAAGRPGEPAGLGAWRPAGRRAVTARAGKAASAGSVCLAHARPGAGECNLSAGSGAQKARTALMGSVEAEPDRQSLRDGWGGDGHPLPLVAEGKLRLERR